MRNDRLRALRLERGETLDKFAGTGHVDPETVERWTPPAASRTANPQLDVATFFGVDEMAALYLDGFECVWASSAPSG
jgi:hypothetical protein